MNRVHPVKDYMSSNIVTLTPGMDIHRAIKVLVERQISGAPVVDEQGQLVGILSERDCLKVAFSTGYHRDWGGRVAEYMHGEVQTVDAHMDIVEMAEIFLSSPYRRFPVVAANRLVGQISRRDVLRALEELW